MSGLLRRLERLEAHTDPAPSMGECFVCCLTSLNQPAKEWPCKPGCRPNADRFDAMAERIEDEMEQRKCASC